MMEAFNIKINIKGKETTLTILPEKNEYKIIYFGGIIGALQPKADDFDFIKPGDVSPGSLPIYKYKQAESTATEPEIKLSPAILTVIKNKVKSIIQHTPGKDRS